MEPDHWDLYHVIGERRIDELKTRLQTGLDPNRRFKCNGSEQQTILEQSLYEGDIACVRTILEAKANVNVPWHFKPDKCRHRLSLLGACQTYEKANLLIRYGLKLTSIERKVNEDTVWPRLLSAFFSHRKAYYVLQNRKARCLRVCALFLHRRNILGPAGPMDFRRDWVKRMIWSTRFDSVWAPRDEEVIPVEFEQDAQASPRPIGLKLRFLLI
jgi:hypothetical protein